MTNYYVRTNGNDGNAGTGPSAASAWQTIGKALGAAGISSGDTVYIAPGTYREVITINMTSAVAETSVIGDVAASQFTDLQGGDVIWTAYTTNDKTAPSGTAFNFNNRDFLTFVDILFVLPDSATPISNMAGATNITFRRCLLQASRNGNIVAATIAADVVLTWTFDSCIFRLIGNQAFVALTLTTSAAADYDVDVVFKNCLFLSGADNQITVTATGAGAFKGGGVKIYNCTCFSPASNFLATQSANVATSAGNQCEVYNCLLVGGGLNANTSGQIVEDYCYIIANIPRTNVSVGANSQTSGASRVLPYALLLHHGQEQQWGQYLRRAFSPMLQSPTLGFGNDASIGVQTEDAFGVPRPAGPARTWANALKAIGWSERGNTASRETTTVRSGTYALKLLGPSVEDVEIPVPASATTIAVYGRYDAAYGAGTLPRMRILANAECGVTEQTDTMVAAADTWEQLSLSVTPTQPGIITVRFMSDGDGDGSAFFDDFSVT